jgi:hypothetical protein
MSSMHWEFAMRFHSACDWNTPRLICGLNATGISRVGIRFESRDPAIDDYIARSGRIDSRFGKGEAQGGEITKGSAHERVIIAAM